MRLAKKEKKNNIKPNKIRSNNTEYSKVLSTAVFNQYIANINDWYLLIRKIKTYKIVKSKKVKKNKNNLKTNKQKKT